MACKHGHWQVMTLNKLKRCSSALSSSEDNDYGSMPASPEPALAPTPKHRWAGGALSRAASNSSDQMPRRRNSAPFVGRLSHHCHYHTCILSAPVACVTLHSSFFCCARRLLGHASTDHRMPSHTHASKPTLKPTCDCTPNPKPQTLNGLFFRVSRPQGIGSVGD